MAGHPLAGVRVLELGNYVAAPAAGRLLADFGAELAKVERSGTGEELRRWRLDGGDRSMLYRTINRSKLSVVLDLASDAGRDAVVELARTSDVLMENFRPGTLERCGIGPDRLTGVNPDLIVARISAFGETGPLSQKPGFAEVAEEFDGPRALVGEEYSPPSGVGVSIGDSIAGLYAAFGVVMRLFERSRTPGLPPSSPVDVALHESVFSTMESLVPDYSAFGVERNRVGGRMEGIAPSNADPCADGGSVIIAGNGDSSFLRLMDVIERPDLGADPTLGENVGRWAYRDELDDAIGGWTATVSTEEALKRLDDAGVPAAGPFTADDITREEQYPARGMIQRFDVSTGAEVLHDVAFPGVVPVLDGISVPVRSLGPDLGQHTDKVLIRAGLSAEQIAAATGGTKGQP